MNITVIGASAGVGLEVVRLALSRGHHVTSLSRSIETLPVDSNLTIIQGSSKVQYDVARAVANAEAIVLTLGTGLDTKPTTLYSDSAKTLLNVMKEQNTNTPVIALTGFGAGDSWSYNSPFMKLLFTFFLKAVYADKTEMERLITFGASNWIMVRPGRLTNGKLTGSYQVLPELKKGMAVGAISRVDVADFLVNEAEYPRYLGKFPALTYR